MTALVLPGDAPYFEVTRRGQLAQGDIFLAPNALVCGVTGDEAASEGPAIPAAVGEAVTVRLWGQPAFGPSSGAPPVNAVAGWTPIMVLTHDCELDKEFNEHVSQYLRDHPGVSEEDVVAMISPRADLHRHAQVAPLLPCDDAVVPAVRHGGIRQARKIGSVPVPAMPAYGIARHTHHKVASLSETARQLLRFKLAEALASRNVALVRTLEAALGRTSVEVRAIKSRNTTATVGLILDDGSEVQVDARIDKKDDVRPERLRPASDVGL